MRISGEKMKKAREAAGFSIYELAAALGKSGQSIAYHERQKGPSRMSTPDVVAIAKKLKVSITDLTWR